MKIQVAQRLGKLQKRGWKPRRTIILYNWDAEEYGLVFSSPLFSINCYTQGVCHIKI